MDRVHDNFKSGIGLGIQALIDRVHDNSRSGIGLGIQALIGQGS